MCFCLHSRGVFLLVIFCTVLSSEILFWTNVQCSVVYKIYLFQASKRNTSSVCSRRPSKKQVYYVGIKYAPAGTCRLNDFLSSFFKMPSLYYSVPSIGPVKWCLYEVDPIKMKFSIFVNLLCLPWNPTVIKLKQL